MFKITPILESIKLLDITDEEYFSSKYVDYISNTRLSLINPDQDGSPEKYKIGIQNLNLFTDSLPVGSAVHAITLQSDKYIISNIHKQSAKLGVLSDKIYENIKFDEDLNPIFEDKIIENLITEVEYYKNRNPRDLIILVKDKCREYLINRYEFEKENNSNVKQIYLSKKQYDKSISCINSLKENNEINNLLHPDISLCDIEVYNEAAIFIDVICEEIESGKEIILSLKTKLDNFSINHTTQEIILNDLKTTGHLLNDFSNTFIKMHYYRQMAFYLWILKLYISNKYDCKLYKLFVNMLLVSTVTYETNIFKVNNNHIINGINEFSTLLKKVAYCEINGYG